jgi:hypothetical protein
MGSNKIWKLIGALSGVVFVVLTIVGMGVAGESGVEPTDSPGVIARAFIDGSDDAEIGGMIALVGILFFFPFLAYFRTRLRAAEGEDGWLTAAMYGGGLVTVAMLLVMQVIGQATTVISGGIDPVVAQTLSVLLWNFVWVLAPPMIAFTLAASIVIVRYSALPKWLGWVGFLVSITLLMPWVGMFVMIVWVALVSLTMTYQVLKDSSGSQLVAEA